MKFIKVNNCIIPLDDLKCVWWEEEKRTIRDWFTNKSIQKRYKVRVDYFNYSIDFYFDFNSKQEALDFIDDFYKQLKNKL